MNTSIITASYGGIVNSKGKISEEITIEDMMYYSMYWENIIVPFNRNIVYELPQEEDFIEAGTLIRPEVVHSGGNTEHWNVIASKELIATYQHYKKEEPNKDFFIYHNVHNNFDELTSPDLIRTNSIRVGLAKLLPYPSNINIQDLLEFKQKREDELTGLHKHLTNLFLDIVNTSHSQDLKQLQVYADFDKSIKDLRKSMNERFPNKILYKDLVSDLKADLIELSGAAAADTALSTFPSGTIVGGITIFTKRVISTILKEQKTDSHLNYIKTSMKEGIII